MSVRSLLLFAGSLYHQLVSLITFHCCISVIVLSFVSIEEWTTGAVAHLWEGNGAPWGGNNVMYSLHVDMPPSAVRFFFLGRVRLTVFNKNKQNTI